MSTDNPIADFNPDGAGNTNGGIFGLPFGPEQAGTVILPIPWEVTVSYTAGTAAGPQAILDASPQLDLYDEVAGEIWRKGIAMVPEDSFLQQLNADTRPKAARIIRFQEAGGRPEDHPDEAEHLNQVNQACALMCGRVQEAAGKFLDAGKRLILLGGDHSTPLGYYRALAERHDAFGILQVDAHLDLRKAYEGFTYSHASIMYNALELKQITRLVQVGVRDFCREEIDKAASEGKRVQYHTGRKLAQGAFIGRSWKVMVDEIIAPLPDKVHISFDIDGLEPWLCPHTGTPVPGGLNFEQAVYLLEAVVKSGRTIIGADLVEVAPGPEGDDWDGNVGARLLYRMCALLQS
jgi:agmatinase